MMPCWRRRRRQLEETRLAIEKSERLSGVIEFQAQEAAAVSSWARDRLERNHLAEAFLRAAGRDC